MQKKTIKVSRQLSENKSNIVPIRLTDSEKKSLHAMKKDMGFKSIRAFIVYSIAVIKKLHGWHTSGLRFYIGESESQAQEVEFEFNSAKEKPRVGA